MSSNKIIRKSKRPILPSTQCEFTKLQESDDHSHDEDVSKVQVKPKKNIIIKKKKKVQVDEEVIVDNTPNTNINVSNRDIINECTNRADIKTSDMTNEDAIDRVSAERDDLIEHKNSYKQSDFDYKLSVIDKVLSDLKKGLTEHSLQQLQKNRVIIDKIIQSNKIPLKQFVSKIDLTGKRDNKDPTVGLLLQGKQYYDNKSSYDAIPERLIALDKQKDKGFGNKPMPPELLKVVNFM